MCRAVTGTAYIRQLPRCTEREEKERQRNTHKKKERSSYTATYRWYTAQRTVRVIIFRYYEVDLIHLYVFTGVHSNHINQDLIWCAKQGYT